MIQSVKYVASIYKIAIKRAERVWCQETDDMAANFFSPVYFEFLSGHSTNVIVCVCVCVCVCVGVCVSTYSHSSIVGYNKVYQRMLQTLKLNNTVRDYCICKE